MSQEIIDALGGPSVGLVGDGFRTGPKGWPEGRTHVADAFSLEMFYHDPLDVVGVRLRCTAISLSRARAVAANGVISNVGPDTAGLFAAVLGVDVPVCRTSVLLETVERILVGQYTGPSLPVGTTVLPPGAELRWWLVAAE